MLTVNDVFTSPTAEILYKRALDSLLERINTREIQTKEQFHFELNRFTMFDADVLHFMQLGVVAALHNIERGYDDGA